MPGYGRPAEYPGPPSFEGATVNESERTLRDIRALLAGAGREEVPQAPGRAGPVPWEDVRRALTLCVEALAAGLAHARYWQIPEGCEGMAAEGVRRMREARDAAGAVLKAIQRSG
jgi:hypothetical protein